MDQIEEIKSKGKLLALLIRRDYGDEGVNFVTRETDAFQVGVILHPAGHEIRPHIHRRIRKENSDNLEFLYIIEGKVEVSFFDGKTLVKKTVIDEGDALLQFDGGHGFKMLEPTKMIEVKQGPYYGNEKEKEYIEE